MDSSTGEPGRSPATSRCMTNLEHGQPLHGDSRPTRADCRDSSGSSNRLAALPLCGFINLSKPPGVTSRDLVNCVQRLVRPTKVGHCGTLDPLAEGVLVVAVGPATRLVQYVQRLPKSYTGTFLLGRQSDTEDVEGTVTELPDARVPSGDELRKAAEGLTGTIQQRPPIFSALKIRGRPAYALARAGKAVHMEPRPVEVYRLDVCDYNYPTLTLEICCGSGTYVRSLGRDLANAVGTAAVMVKLVRSAIGSFRLADAASADELTRDSLPGMLVPIVSAVQALPCLTLEEGQLRAILYGQRVPLSQVEQPADEVALLDGSGNLRGIAAIREGWLIPGRNFPIC